jgi:nucleoside recognition membrane protein YjiH
MIFTSVLQCVQLLKQELEIQREKAKNVNLAEAAAQRSAILLDQTQASTHVGAGLLVVTHMVYLMIGIFSIVATGLTSLYDKVEL